MINKTDNELALEKRLEGIKEDLKAAESMVNNMILVSISNGKDMTSTDSFFISQAHQSLLNILNRHFPTEYEYGEIK